MSDGKSLGKGLTGKKSAIVSGSTVGLTYPPQGKGVGVDLGFFYLPCMLDQPLYLVVSILVDFGI